MKKFIYVFDEQSRDQLLKDGFRLIQSDEKKRVYVFLNSPEILFSLNGASCIQTNTISL